MNSKDDHFPTPKAFKLFRASDEYFEENLNKMINENTIWLSQAKDFNDPLEMSSFVNAAELEKNARKIVFDFKDMIVDQNHKTQRMDVLKKFLPIGLTLQDVEDFLDYLGSNPEFLEHPYEMFLEIAEQHVKNPVDMISQALVDGNNRFIEGFYLLSLTDNISNSAMWAYYAELHEGIAVEFYRSSPISAQSRPITYTDKISDTKMDSMDYLYTKNLYWRHESERRYFVRKELAERDGTFIKNTNYFRFYDERLKNCEGNIVKAIYIGLKAPHTIIEKVLELRNKTDHFIQVYLTGTNIQHYSLEFEPLFEEPG